MPILGLLGKNTIAVDLAGAYIFLCWLYDDKQHQWFDVPGTEGARAS